MNYKINWNLLPGTLTKLPETDLCHVYLILCSDAIIRSGFYKNNVGFVIIDRIIPNQEIHSWADANDNIIMELKGE